MAWLRLAFDSPVVRASSPFPPNQYILTMPSSPSQPPRRSHSRSRSRSPPPRRRTDDRPRPSASGFRWKDKSSQPSDDPYDRRHDDRRLERGYRDRDARERDRDRDRYRERDDQRDGGRPHREPRDPRHEDREGARSRDEARGDEGDRRGRGGERRNDNVDDGTRRDPFGETTTDGTATKAKKEKKTREPKIAPTAEPMIIVNVNDRLGTKAAIPCLASDSIRTLFPPPPPFPFRLDSPQGIERDVVGGNLSLS